MLLASGSLNITLDDQKQLVPTIRSVLQQVVKSYEAQDDLPCSEHFRFKVELLLEEMLLNIFGHGYQNHGGAKTRLRYKLYSNHLRLILSDSAQGFDSVQQGTLRQHMEMPDDIDTMALGGNGLMLVKKMASAFSYRRVNQHNINMIDLAYE